MTAHWICVKTLHRQSASIGLKRFVGHHTGEKISEIIHNILLEYGILSKIVKIVTDNAANFVKALKPEIANAEDNETINEKLISLAKILQTPSNINIPLHQRCCAHTINLCMTHDVNVALKAAVKNLDEESELEFDEDSIFESSEFDADVTIIDSGLNYHKISESALKKCKNLWNKQSRSSLAGDFVKEKLGVYLKTPVDTRWNSLLDACSHILSCFKQKPTEFKSIFTKLQLDFFSKEELTFLENYVKVSSSI